ncbi:hypothetical protein LCM10_09135 [Rossellomorea aquimaris]|uniref:hypothetical protein n=1 Tax=Rossellomorea aquimaris TaxID=189382 RepID=UPI001CD4667A|nr:hypothetical protein [Rossellomorea aquimaris]MCA1055150.1 hypothetical protein [Rossellomorea aquimaris]
MPASYHNQGGINLSFLTPEEIMIKKKNKRILMYIGIFTGVAIVVGGTTVLAYGL